MAGGRRLAVLAVVAVVLGLGYVAFRVYRGSNAESCYACQRPIHMHSRTVALVNGRPKLFCCPACALSEHEQEGKPIQVTELTSYLDGAKLSPSAAFLVKGSDINMCAHAHEMMGADKQAEALQYDRCSPSLLAFGKRNDAVQFAREHGGQVMPFNEIVAAFTH